MTTNSAPLTLFDTPQRTPVTLIEETTEWIAGMPIVVAMLEAFPGAAVLLDENRQIVAVNKRAVSTFDMMSPFDVYGLRFGDAVGCICPLKAPNGCGTGEACAECGAAHAIRYSRESGVQTIRECRLRTSHESSRGALDLRVTATPFKLQDRRLTVLAIEDIADEKRRENLERIFFHDVLGTVNAAHGLAKMAAAGDPATASNVGAALLRATGQLLDEIQSQRDLLAAEQGTLAIAHEPASVNEMLETVHQQYVFSPLAEGRALVFRPLEADVKVSTDRVQVVRSLGNLVRNALEAAAEGQDVIISGMTTTGGVLFQVANAGYIPENLQVQIFQRSFSTKAPRGRGIGTYSVQLVVEHYLGGRVSFVSSKEDGTVFSIWLPSGR